jgi:hypothetical protein
MVYTLNHHVIDYYRIWFTFLKYYPNVCLSYNQSVKLTCVNARICRQYMSYTRKYLMNYFFLTLILLFIHINFFLMLFRTIMTLLTFIKQNAHSNSNQQRVRYKEKVIHILHI